MPIDVDRRRGLLIVLAVYAPVTVMASMVSSGHRLFTAAAMTVALPWSSS